MAVRLGLCTADVKLFGPLHDHDVAPVAEPVSDNALPEHTGFGDALALTVVGDDVYTVMEDVIEDVMPHAFVAVSVYTPPEAAVAVRLGLCTTDVKLLGPLHDHEVAFVDKLVRNKALPEHMGLGAPKALTDVGVAV